MSKKYRIKIEDVPDFVETTEVLLKHRYVFFKKLRLTNLEKIIEHINRYLPDSILRIKWLVIGHCECRRLIGASGTMDEDGETQMFGTTSDYQIVTLEEFLKLNE